MNAAVDLLGDAHILERTNAKPEAAALKEVLRALAGASTAPLIAKVKRPVVGAKGRSGKRSAIATGAKL